MEKLRDVYTLYHTRGLKCDGCNLGNSYFSAGYSCFRSGLFFHKECAESEPTIHNLYHPQHSLNIKVLSENEEAYGNCKLCRGNLPKMYYCCSICDFSIDLICARKKVMTTIESPNTHEHPLSLVPEMGLFTCHLCGLHDDRFPYACNLCNVSFHKDCAESTPEIQYSCHPKHILKRLTDVPKYTNGKCCLCGNKLHYIFYHCSICNFSVDVNCVKNPLPSTLVHVKAHEHLLTLMPQRSFVCDVCGMSDDPNPYVCLPCNFMVHRNCLDMPRVVKIYRHDHRIYYNHYLGAGDWKCGVCNKEINWTCGAFSCAKCSDFAIHPRCLTRFGIWDGTELEGVPENNPEVKSFEVNKEEEIKHFSHEKHLLKLKEESGANDEYLSCKSCNYPIYTGLFYSCMECDNFNLHEKCASLPQKKIDAFYNMPTTLITNDARIFICNACQDVFQGFRYTSDDRKTILDVRCGSISEPFVHESHPFHSLYINHAAKDLFCNACGVNSPMVLSCEECEFVLDIKCAVLPKIAKHKNDKDHFLSLCYGEKTSEQYWCEICEEEVNPEKWFYSCDDCGITNHIKCVVGDFKGMKMEKDNDEPFPAYMVINNRINRPICFFCKSRCYFFSILEVYGKSFCSLQCFQKILSTTI
ncbi:hypothetical protein CARUB_v10016829mg [Capsella rubella]|uniref:Phorbol-ester/DAG-type domain-containing protein n=1 Tax=Capsella rubella TaxID=81985 RepID=R0HH85_9BRAS|nr:uncharacterized protein LOC17886284 [Capsella rubella]EOA23168.1 hypothetical protein CARUB_v10016829mg [Capsella rubella]